MKVIQNRRNVTPIIIKSTWNKQINSILDLSSQLIECFASSKFLYQANTRKKQNPASQQQTATKTNAFPRA